MKMKGCDKVARKAQQKVSILRIMGKYLELILWKNGQVYEARNLYTPFGENWATTKLQGVLCKHQFLLCGSDIETKMHDK